jgi:uncharacterized protein (DUF302 family)
MSRSFVDHPYAAVRREHTLAVPYEGFTRAFESLLGVMQVDALRNIADLSPEEARTRLASFVGPLDFSLFQKLDHGALIRTLTGQHLRATTYVFGNALIAVEMTKHAPTIGLYVPLRLYVRETGPAETKASYDLPSGMVGQFESPEANEVARALDAKVERILAEAETLTRRTGA